MLQKDPSLTPNVIKARLMRTATKTFPWQVSVTDPVTGVTYTSQHDLFAVGAGYVDADAALNDVSTSSSVALSPKVIVNSTTQAATLSLRCIAGVNVIWGDNAIWGDTTLFDTAMSVKGEN